MGYETIVKDALGQAFGLEKDIKPKYAQDLVPIKDIVQGMIITHDERYIKVIEVEPINFPLKEDSEQNNIISTFASWLRLAPQSCQLQITVDLKTRNAYVEKLMQSKFRANNPVMKQLYESNIQFIESITSRTAIDRRHYLIFEYEANKRDAGKKLSYDYISHQLNNVVLQAREYFGAMGNTFVSHEDENIFLGELLYRQLNKRTSLKTPFMERVKRVIRDIERIDENNGDDIDIHYENLISPMGISCATSPDCMIFDGMYHAYYYIANNGYPLEVYSGWLSNAFAVIPGVDINIFARKQNKADFVRILNQQRKFTSLKARNKTEHHADYGDVIDAYQSQQYFSDGLGDDNNPQDPYYMSVVFAVHAHSYEELQIKCDKLKEKALTNRLTIYPTNYFQHQGFLASLPLNYIPNKLYSKSRRNLLTSDLAGIYPFTHYELNEPNGIFLGINLYNQTVCAPDLYNRDKYANANMTILGGSGAGKTYTLSLLAERLVLLEKQVFIITSLKGHEFRRLCRALGGTFIKFASAEDITINIFDIRPEAETKEKLYDAENAVSWLAQKSASISGWFQLLFKDLTEEEKILLDRAVKEVYAVRGITHENSSIFIDGDKSKGIKEMPIIEDMLTVLEDINKNPQTPVPRRIFSMLSNFVEGSYSCFNGQTNVDLSDERRIIVFDLEDISDAIEASTIQLTMDFIWGRIKEDPTRQKTLIIEEGWKYLSKGASESSAKLIQQIFKVIRGYGGNAILATQEIGDIIASEYGRSVISCSALKILMGVEEGADAHLLQSHMGLLPAEASKLESYRKGACLLLAGKDHIPMQVQASQLEHEMITTDMHDLANILQAKTGESI